MVEILPNKSLNHKNVRTFMVGIRELFQSQRNVCRNLLLP